MTGREQTLVLYSRLAFYPVHYLALEEIVRRYAARAVVLAPAAPADLPTVHQAHGTADPDAMTRLPISVRRVPPGSRGSRLAWVARQLRDVRPDAIWVQEEPIDPFLLEMLALYRFRGRPRIVTAVCENIFPRPRRLAERTARRLLWPRLDHLITVARPSLDGIRAAGMPRGVPASTLVAGGLEPESEVAPLELPFARDGDFVVGFAGRIVPQKGWRVLVDAVSSLEGVHAVFAGDGSERAALEKVAADEPRIHYLGLLPKGELWSFYAALDCLAVPSLTTERWKEQSASTLVDGLVMGLPIVASNSGGIPDMMGPAGLLVSEGDPKALAAAIARLREEVPLRTELAALGRERFRREFAIPVYADKIAASLNLHVRSVALSP
jgi:glycosyltransferase involved in cell wall biosynthesis